MDNSWWQGSWLLGAVVLLVGLALGILLGVRIGRTTRQHSVDPVGAVTAVLAPAADALHRMQEQLQRVEADRIGSYSGLREQVAALRQSNQELGATTRSLVGALHNPNARGRWGEVQLQRIVELAGMVEHCDFSTQVGVTAGEDAARPDLVIRLAGGRTVPVDAKVPLQACLDAAEVTDPARRSSLLRDHARAVRQHVETLGRKQYWRAFAPSPEFVVMFIPADGILDAALQQDPSITEFAFESNVVIATPSTLIALLRTVAFTWRAERLSRSADEVHALGRELHSRLATLTEHFGKLGSSLQRSVDSYNQAMRSLDSRVLVTTRRFTELGVVTTELEGPELISSRTIGPAQGATAPSQGETGRSQDDRDDEDGSHVDMDLIARATTPQPPDRSTRRWA